MADAFQAIERARGRVEVKALAHHEAVAPGEPDAAQIRLTSLNVRLFNSDDPKARSTILAAIYSAEQQLPGGASSIDVPPAPVPLAELQRDLHHRSFSSNTEYVLADPHSALAKQLLTRCCRYGELSKLIREHFDEKVGDFMA
jgi:hypothetical protein